MTPVSICTIAKNEEKYIEGFIKAVKKAFGTYPHEIVLVDTGSSDHTVDIAKKYLDNVYTFEWIGDFSAAKNYALSKAKYDLVINLDCDEYIKSVNPKEFDLFYPKSKDSLGVISLINHLGSTVGERTKTDELPRVFNKKHFHFEGKVHEQLRPNASFEGNCSFTKLSIVADHFGYMGDRETLRKKVQRNNELLFNELSSNPNDPYIYYQLGKSYSIIEDYENAAQYFGKGLEFDLNPDLEYVKEMVLGYGYALLELNRFEEALSYEGIYEEFCEDIPFLTLMGLIYLKNNLLEEAYIEFTKATNLPLKSSEDASIKNVPYYNLGIINEVLGNKTEAKAFYKKCINCPPADKRISDL